MVGGTLCRVSSEASRVTGSNLSYVVLPTINSLRSKLLFVDAARVFVGVAIASSNGTIGQTTDAAVQ